MPKFQSLNTKTDAWFKYSIGKEGSKILDVKQKLPTVPFENIPIRGLKRK